MAQKRIIQSFESFTGVDLSKSALSASQNVFQSLLNMEPAKSASIRGRRGCQISNHYGNFTGLNGFAYANPVTGATTEELLVINDNLFKEISTSFTITRVAGALDFSWQILPPDGVTRTTFRFVLTQGGSPVTLTHPVTSASAAYLDLGTGLEDTIASSAQWPTSVLDLIQAIDNTANFSVAYPAKTARIASIGGAGTLNVQAGHTVTTGDVISLFDTTTKRLVPVKVTATTGTTLSYDNSRTFRGEIGQSVGAGCTPAASIFVESSGSTTTGAALTVGYVYWQGVITAVAPYKNYVFPFEGNYAAKGSSSAKSSTFRPPTFVDANQSSYIFTEVDPTTAYPWEGYVYKYDRQNIYRAGMPEYVAPFAATRVATAGGLTAGNYQYRVCYNYYDNNGVLVQGMYQDSNVITSLGADSGSLNLYTVQNGGQKILGVITTVAGPTTTLRINSSAFVPKVGDYIYFRDFTGPNINLTTRQVTSVAPATATENDIGISGLPVAVVISNFTIPSFGWNFNCAVVNGNQVSVGNTTTGSAITVYHDNIVGTYKNFNTLKVGDTIRVFDSLTSTYQTRVLTSVTPTTIGWSVGGSVNVTGELPISCNLNVAIYRTKVGGTKFYKVAEYPNHAYADVFTYVDGAADTLLIEEFIEPAIGKEPNPPPRAGIGCAHQGKIVYSRLVGEPNTFAWSDDVSGIEAVPLASNYADLPPTVGGPITAIGSDADSRLAVFKENAYYDVPGDLETGSISITGIKEGDYGVSSHASIKKVNGVLIGIGKLGIVAVARGQMISDVGALGSNAWISDSQGSFAQLGEKISASLINNQNLAYAQAVAINDRFKRMYNFYVPSTESYSTVCTPSSVQTFSYPVSFAWDYGHNFGWFDRAYAGFGIEPSGGLTNYSGGSRFISCVLGSPISQWARGVPYRYFPDTAPATTSCADNHYYVKKQIVTYPLSPNGISFDAQYQLLKVFRFVGAYELNDLNAFSLRLRTYFGFQTSVVDSTRTYSFTNAITNAEVFTNLNSGKARAMLFWFDATYDFSQSIQQLPYVSGYEMITDVDYGKEDYHD